MNHDFNDYGYDDDSMDDMAYFGLDHHRMERGNIRGHHRNNGLVSIEEEEAQDAWSNPNDSPHFAVENEDENGEDDEWEDLPED
jgi:hypothetical protein